MESSQPKRPPVFTVKYRASSPALRREPKSTYPPLPDTLLAHKAPFIDKARQVLEGYGLFEGDDTKVDLLHRTSAGEDIPTLYMTTPWRKSTCHLWRRAVEDIKAHVDGVLDDDEIDLHVEMMAPDLFMLKNLDAASGITTAEWESVRAMVQERLERFEATRGCMTTIALFRLGFSERVEENPNTVYVSLKDESDEVGWEEVMAEIEEELRERNLGDVEVLFEHNAPWTSGGFD